MKFKIGQRVMCIKEHSGNKSIIGKVGKIVYIHPRNSYDSYLVEFNRYIYGHDGGSKGRDGHCWWLPKDKLKPISKERIE